MAAIAGLLAAFDRMTPGGSLPTPTLPSAPEFRTPLSVVVEPNRRQSVVLVSLGGAGAGTLADWMAEGAMPVLSHLAEQGWTTTLRSVSPPLPGPALTALATGAISAGAEPIWQTAARHHLTTALLFWPGTDPATPDRRADYTLTCAPSSSLAIQQTVILSPASSWAGAPTSFSPPYEGEVTLSSATLNVLAIDTLDDDQAIYDTFFFVNSRGSPATATRTVDRNTPRLALDSWETVPVLGPATSGLMLTVTGLRTLTRTVPGLSLTTGVTPTTSITPMTTSKITPTATLTPLLELTLYQIASQPVMAHPATLGQKVIQQFGFCPPLPHPGTVAQGWLSPAAFRELASSRARWTMRVAAYVYETYRPHLLLVRQEALSVSEQALLLTDPRQPGYSRARIADFTRHRRAMAAVVDDGLDDLMATVDLNYATVLVISEHGMVPVHTEVNVATALQTVRRRLARLDTDSSLWPRGMPPLTPRRLYAEGAFLSVEIGPDGKSENVVQVVLRALSALTDPHTGKPIFARVVRREDAGSWAETWPYPGDVLAQAEPGYALADTPRIGVRGQTLSKALVYGQAGHDVHLPAMQGTLMAAGRGVSAQEQGDVASLVDIASMVATWLGILSPANSP